MQLWVKIRNFFHGLNFYKIRFLIVKEIRKLWNHALHQVWNLRYVGFVKKVDIENV